MTEFATVMPVLKVTDIERAVAFYSELLGFEIVWRAPNDGGGENCMLGAGAANVLLSTGAHLGDTPQFTGILYFQMTGVSDFFER
jgi:catechol 2,3-dioxygenase-like lactoylglutathione lyase family enzyme